MSCPFNKESLDQLKRFIDVCSTNPELLSLPDLDFFRKYVESLGGTVPVAARKQPKMSAEPDINKPGAVPTAPDSPEKDAESEPESDIELDTEGCIEPDQVDETAQKMGDPSKIEVTEEEQELSSEKRVQAMTELGQNNIDKAIQLLTEAIELNPQSGGLFAKRGQAYLRANKPRACIRDCTRALELNPDSALAYKFRGRAYRLIGEWEKAAKDLRQACTIDFDEQADEWLKEVQPNARKIEQHRLKYEKRRSEKEEREKLRRARAAREAHERASAAAGAAFAGAGGVPSGGSGPGIFEAFAQMSKDPELAKSFADPEVMEAFSKIAENPEKMEEYAKNPKIMSAVVQILGKMGPAGLQGMFGNAAPNADILKNLGKKFGDASAAGAPPTADDDNLD